MSARPESEWRLVPMHPAHVPQVMDIERRAYEFPWTEGILRDCLRVGYSAWVLRAATGADAPLAYAIMSMAVGEAQVLNLAVDPQHRRRGLARHLLAQLLEIARAAHCTTVLLEVRRSNKAAIALYHAAGFRQIGMRRQYYPSHTVREDAFVLSLDLP